MLWINQIKKIQIHHTQRRGCMKKILGVLLLMTQAGAPFQIYADSCDCKVTSHTFFTTRPQYQSASPERVSFFRDPMIRENGHGGTMQFTLFGGKSTRDKKLGNYFAPFCKDSLVVKESVDADTDLDAQNFGIVTVNGLGLTAKPFESTIKIRPHQSVFGLGFTYRQNLGNWFSCLEDCERPWWFEISTPLVRVQNCVELNEVITEDGGGVGTVAGLPEEQVLFASMRAAFNQAAWKYGKINDGDKMTKTRLADIELKLGYTWLQSECCGIESWIGVLVPTGNRPTAEFMFEPIVGHNKHWGLLCGNSAYFRIWENDCWTVTAYADLSSKYLFSRTEKRSFDLKYRPWSRYLEIYANIEQAQQALALGAVGASAYLASPGINFFTQDFNVKPRFSHTMNLALAAQYNCWDLEAGYNLFTREAECISLKDALPETAVVKASTGEGRTNRYRRIDNELNAINDAVFSTANYTAAIIKESDIDLTSAVHPGFISHTIYGALGYKFEDYCYPMFIGAGTSYECGGGNETLNRWTLWGKFGFSF